MSGDQVSRRSGEFSWLRWQDVDLEECRLDVVSRRDHLTKTRKSRSVALRDETADLLRRLCIRTA